MYIRRDTNFLVPHFWEVFSHLFLFFRNFYSIFWFRKWKLTYFFFVLLCSYRLETLQPIFLCFSISFWRQSILTTYTFVRCSDASRLFFSPFCVLCRNIPCHHFTMYSSYRTTFSLLLYFSLSPFIVTHFLSVSFNHWLCRTLLHHQTVETTRFVSNVTNSTQVFGNAFIVT